MKIENVLNQISDELKPVVVSMHNTILQQQEEIHRLRRQIFGTTSEKFVLGERIDPKESLFNEAEIEDAGQDSAEENNEQNTDSQNRNSRNRSPQSGGRHPLPDDLPRDRIEHDLVDEKKTCPNDGAELIKISEEIVETLDYIPGRFFVTQHVYPKYACPECKQHVVQTPAQPSILPQTQCGPSLLAHIIVCKYFLALPLYRQESEFKQMGVELSRTSLARWVIKGAEFLSPLLALLKAFILEKPAIHADETTVQVLREKDKGPQSNSFMWTLCTTTNDPPAVYYEYHDSRSGKAALTVLQDFKGLLHVDGYAGYNSVVKSQDLTRVGCWSHVRRKFDVANKDGAGSGKTVSCEFLALIQKLFLLERNCQALTRCELAQQRQAHALPVVAEIRSLLDKHHGCVPPKSKLGMALSYLASEWNTLTVFLTDGNAALSNNRMENFIRPFAVGRKNWLFAETPAGAQASAALYSLLITAQANDVNLRAYLTSLFTEVPLVLAHDPTADLSVYLPWNWKSSHPTESQMLP